MRKTWIEKQKWTLSLLRIRYFCFWGTNWLYHWLYHIHGAANFWAELDLNQRRHIANEFTVRPH